MVRIWLAASGRSSRKRRHRSKRQVCSNYGLKPDTPIALLSKLFKCRECGGSASKAQRWRQGRLIYRVVQAAHIARMLLRPVSSSRAATSSDDGVQVQQRQRSGGFCIRTQRHYRLAFPLMVRHRRHATTFCWTSACPRWLAPYLQST